MIVTRDENGKWINRECSLEHAGPERPWDLAVTPGDELYERLFRECDTAPSVLYGFGNPELLLKPTIAWVGARHLTAESVSMARHRLFPEIRDYLSQRGGALSSGGAIGADQLGADMALDCGLPVVAWLPSGLLNPYPESFAKSQMSRILKAGGLVLSSFPPSQAVRKSSFASRNLWIACQASGIVGLQVGEKSGTLMTCLRGLKLGKAVGVVPGHPMHSASSGGYICYESGATLLHDRASVRIWLDSIIALAH